jgi:hypothetical protein
MDGRFAVDVAGFRCSSSRLDLELSWCWWSTWFGGQIDVAGMLMRCYTRRFGCRAGLALAAGT